ncbi:hypothetical protein FOL47_001676 [Perkinsus chesapeaki]|uniref:EamA domain-containing protein n=1 Tax=Perkinsus chesapeaki TaxID=330153 RepID=A0A7J6KTH8_PERCH|nr:hypothetical protein FOL47_001676 [Perkinsus chesapeaki]
MSASGRSSYPIDQPVDVELTVQRKIPKAGHEEADEISLKGSSLCTLSAFLFSIMQLCAHLASDSFSSSEIMFARCVVQTVVSASVAMCIEVNPFGPDGRRAVCLLRGSLGALSNFALFYAVTHMPVGDANAIFFTSPLFTSLGASLLLHEPFTKIECAALFSGLTGALLVARPSFLFGSSNEASEHPTLAVIFAMCGALVSSSVPLVVRWIRESVHYVCLVFYFGACGTLMSLGVMLSGLQPVNLPRFADDSKGYLLLLMVSLLGVTAQFAFNRSMQIEKPQNCAILRQLDVAFTFLWQHLFASAVNPLSLLGAIMVLGSSSAIFLSKIFASRSSNSATSMQTTTVMPQMIGKE